MSVTSMEEVFLRLSQGGQAVVQDHADANGSSLSVSAVNGTQHSTKAAPAPLSIAVNEKAVNEKETGLLKGSSRPATPGALVLEEKAMLPRPSSGGNRVSFYFVVTLIYISVYTQG